MYVSMYQACMETTFTTLGHILYGIVCLFLFSNFSPQPFNGTGDYTTQVFISRRFTCFYNLWYQRWTLVAADMCEALTYITLHARTETKVENDLWTFVNKTWRRFKPQVSWNTLKLFHHSIIFAKCITIWKAYNSSSEWHNQLIKN